MISVSTSAISKRSEYSTRICKKGNIGNNINVSIVASAIISQKNF